jgi:RNase P subunit RPR2
MSQPCRVELPEDFGKAQKCSETNANKLQHDATQNWRRKCKKCLILLVPGERIELATDGLQSRASFALLQ